MPSSNSTPSMAASGDGAAKPAGSVHVPLEGLVLPKSAVVESTGSEQVPAVLELLEEEGDSHKGDWRGSDITDSDIKELVVEGYLPSMEGLVWRVALAARSPL